MKINRLIVSCIVCLALLLPQSTVNAAPYSTMDKEISMEDILSTEETIVYQSDIALFYPESGSPQSRTHGTYPIKTRMTETKTGSGGVVEMDSIAGAFSDVGGLFLTFWSGVPSMAVSVALSVGGMVVDANDYVEAKTFQSYIRYEKRGEACWADENVFYPYVYSGKVDYYKHVMTTVEDEVTHQTTTSMTDYLETPASTETGVYYNNSTSWFQQKAKEGLQTGIQIVDLPW